MWGFGGIYGADYLLIEISFLRIVYVMRKQ
jgi:hypothetical protein